jgi:uncharacterized protein YbaP (TraB family)
MRRLLLALFVLLVLLSGPGPAIAEPVLRFYRVENPQGRVSYFYPSFHLKDERIVRPPTAVLDAVKRLVIEADVAELERNPQKLVPYIVSPRPLDLAALFTAQQIAVIRARAACNGIPAGVEKLRPLFIGMMVGLPCPKPGVALFEREFEQAAQARGYPVTALEGADEEFSAMSSLPESLFIGEIRKYADRPAAAQTLVDAMIELYNGGDYDGLYALSLANMPEDAATRRLFIDTVLLARNRTMVERMAGALAEGDALVVVGALHLPGPDGIVDLLQRRGFKVSMIDARAGTLR